MAEIQVAKTFSEVSPVRKLLKDCVGDYKESDVLMSIPVEASVITGKLNGIYNDQLVMISFSKNHYKYLLEAYIKYVLVTAQGLSLELNYISAHENAVFTISKNTMSQTKAMEVLVQLVAWFRTGHEEIFLFYPGLNENPLKMAGYDQVKFGGLIDRFLERNPDEYLQKEYNNGIFSTATINQFMENMVRIFLPVAEVFPALIPLPKNSTS